MVNTIVLVTLLSGTIVSTAEFPTMTACLMAKEKIAMQRAEAVCTYKSLDTSFLEEPSTPPYTNLDKFIELMEHFINKQKGECI